MALLPQELWNAIVHEIDDIPTLKASCLAGTVFREESQRNLFRSFRLNCRDRKRFDGLRTLLDTSPHIAPYITCFSISFKSDPEILPPDKKAEGLFQVYRALGNVRSCTVTHWDIVKDGAALLSPFLAFLSRQPLRELNVAVKCSLPPVVCLHFMTVAPAISFTHVFIADDADFPRPSDWQPAVPRIRELILGKRTLDVNTLLACAQPQEYTPEGLLRISLYCIWDLGNSLVFTHARTLEHIEFKLLATLGPPPIPLLPVLRSVQLSSWREHQKPWFFDLVSTVLGSGPLLTDLTLEFPLGHAHLHIRPELLHTLDTALIEHTTVPSIRWRLLLSLDADDREDTLADFVAQVRRGMPRVDEKHRLVLEAYGPKVGAGCRWRYERGTYSTRVTSLGRYQYIHRKSLDVT
ncbi:hypothetical protein B0H16DRAFT_1773085 [Mycena metata]|uniref:Uncharacterized protein n=1 Tax=Mycena metata TaxID=1033252 RepID=A0AAD7MSU8_9AGAR|nr:hypothetical protein B0H16DRAFT_1773085 [Mycena metata]